MPEEDEPWSTDEQGLNCAWASRERYREKPDALMTCPVRAATGTLPLNLVWRLLKAQVWTIGKTCGRTQILKCRRSSTSKLAPDVSIDFKEMNSMSV